MSDPASEPNRAVTLIEPRRGWLSVDWGELWAYRNLWSNLAKRDIQIRYKQTVLGAAWAVLQPVLTMVVFSAFFGRMLKVSSDGLPYPVFSYAGLLPWTFFSATVTAAAGSMIGNTPLLTKVYFPRLLLPLSTLGRTLLDLALASLVVMGMMFYYGLVPSWKVLFLPLVLLGVAASAVGAGTLLAALTVKYRDFRYTLTFMIQLWLFVTPVIYPSSSIPQKYLWLISLNPMTGLITSFRSCLLGSPLDPSSLAISSAVGLILLAAGFAYFRQVEDGFADIV